MSSAPYDLSISAARAGALFASPLQRSDEPSARQVWQAIATAIAAYGVRGCAARVAQDYGEHPETALTRMRWARTAAASASGGSQAEPTHVEQNLYWITDGTYRSAFLTDSVGAVLLDAPPTIGSKIQRAADETDRDLLLENNRA